MSATRKYLQRHAEPEIQELANWPATRSFKHVVVIPAYDENPDFLHRLIEPNGLLAENQALAIIVVNRPDTSSQCPRNDQLINTIQEHLPQLWSGASDPANPNAICTLNGRDTFGILTVNRHSTPIPYKQGVGLARKIGSDLATALIATGHIESPWIHSTDADAHLPTEYFHSVKQLSNQCSAACYGFDHIDDDTEISAATQWYQASLHHYRNGLAQAGSPYARFTIGSTLVFQHRAYSQAHGFPKRAGGEDFYLLNKLAKLGNIETLPATIKLEARPSHRVPFGTGPAATKILQSIHSGEPLLSYHPEIFIELGRWLTLATDAIQNSTSTALNIDDLNLRHLHLDSQQALQKLDLKNCWRHLNQSPDTQWRLRHFHHWFDAFRTLKFVHYLQEHSFPPQPLTPEHHP